MWTRPRLVAAVLIGTTFGAVDSFANASGGPGEESVVQSVARFASYLLNAGWAWAALAVAAGWMATTPAPAVPGRAVPSGGAPARGAVGVGAAAGSLAAGGAVLTYYVSDSILRAEPFARYVDELLIWLVASVLLCGPLGAVGALVRRPGRVGLLAALVVPAGAALQVTVLAPGFDVPPVQPVHPEAVLARWLVLTTAAVAVVLLVRRRWAGRSRRGGSPTRSAGGSSTGAGR